MIPKVSVIFPTFNGLADTKTCLESIRKLKYPKERIEIIMVDNCSSDRTIETIKKMFPEVKILPQNNNLGFAKAVNLGIKTAKGEYFLITNNDVTFTKNYLTQLVDFLQKKPLVGITGGKVYYKRPQKKISFPGAKFDFYTGLLRPNKNPNQIIETDWVPGCNMLIKREVLENIGIFDEDFFFYFEDLDFCLRARKAGYKVIYYPKAVMYHGEGVSIDKERWQKKSQFYYEGKTRVLFKHASKIQLVSVLLFQFLLGLPFHLLVLKRQNYTWAFRALMKSFKDPKVNPSIVKYPKQPPQDLPSVTFVFPTLNGRLLIDKVLSSIKEQNYPQVKIEVIVVDNASTDGTPEIIKKKFPWVNLIRMSKNTGSAPPITMGAKIARGDYILATNDDVIFEKNCLRELVKLALSDSRIGITTGKMLDLDPPHKPLFFGFRINLYFGYNTFDFKDTDKIRECDWAPGACIFISKELLKRVCYFDDEYIFCGDDYDVCFQVRSLGYKIMYTPKALYYHGFTRAKGKNGPTREHLFAHYRGKIRFMVKNASLLQIVTFLPVQIIFGPFYSYLKFGHKTLFPLLKALFWNTKHLEETLRARQISKRRRLKILKQIP